MTAWSRSGELERLGHLGRADVLVIGGGVVGAGVALDLAGRGISVVLAERADFASGTSSRSTKLLHGGIRYLPQLRFGLVREGLREQKLLGRNADYLCRPLEFVIPIYRGGSFGDLPRWARLPGVLPIALRTGLWLYDRLGSRDVPGHRKISAAEAIRLVPGLRPEGLRHGFVYTDAQTDDARLVLAILETAVATGRVIAVNRLEVAELRRDAEGFSARCVDTMSGSDIAVTSHTVVAATGAFPPPNPGGCQPVEVVTSKGAHLVLDPAAVGIGSAAVVLPETEDGRVMFVVPWQGVAIVGTTDTLYSGDPARPAADSEDVAYLERHLERYLDGGTLRPIATWAGLRALVGNGPTTTAKVSRAHKTVEIAPGYFQVAGGKLTGYRTMAAAVAKKVAHSLRHDGSVSTAHTPLAGSGITPGMIEALAGRLARLGTGPGYAGSLAARYGSNAARVVELAEADRTLAAPLGGGTLLAEVAHAARYEAAAAISDFTLRRTRISWMTEDHGRDAAPIIAAVLGRELGWDDAERARQLEIFEAELTSEGL